jgi:pilus assembly protein CpaE
VILRLTIDAFPLTAELRSAVEALRSDSLLSRSRITLVDGGLAAAIEHYRGSATPQVLIVEDHDTGDVLRERLERLAEVCVAGTQVIVVGRVNDIATYRRLLSLGIGDYLVGPVGSAQLAGAIESLFAGPSAAPKGRVLAFIGARGGAGSSALAHNTAWTIAEMGDEDVIVADFDVAFGTVGLAFNVDSRQTIAELLTDPARVDGQLVDRVLVRADDRLQLLLSPGLGGVSMAVDIEAVDGLMDLLRRMAGTVVVDLPHAWAPWIAHVLETADEALIVTQPDLAGLRDAKALIDLLVSRRAGREPARIIVNKVDLLRKTQISAKDFEDALKLKPAAWIPFDPIFGEALNEGRLAVDMTRSHKLKEALSGLAQLVGGRHLRSAGKGKNGRNSKNGKNGGGGWLGWMKRIGRKD